MGAEEIKAAQSPGDVGAECVAAVACAGKAQNPVNPLNTPSSGCPPAVLQDPFPRGMFPACPAGNWNTITTHSNVLKLGERVRKRHAKIHPEGFHESPTLTPCRKTRYD